MKFMKYDVVVCINDKRNGQPMSLPCPRMNCVYIVDDVWASYISVKFIGCKEDAGWNVERFELVTR